MSLTRYSAPRRFRTRDQGFCALRVLYPLGLPARRPSSLPANNVRELIALTKAAGHPELRIERQQRHAIRGECLNILARISRISRKGAAPSLSDVLGGQIPLAFVGPPPALPHVKSGKIRRWR